jgi:hypothetical protein
MPEDPVDHINFTELKERAVSRPLVKHIYTADPSAHVFGGRIYIYPSHDVENDIPFDDLGSHFDMQDYHVISMDSPDAKAIDHGVALHINDVPWAEKQMWAPDATEKNGTYYLYFPAKAHDGIFRIGVATSSSPTGPFTPQPEAIKGSFSIDPAVFKDDNGQFYMYFGGIWGGQLQRWRNGIFIADEEGPLVYLPESNEQALCPKVARLRDDLLEFAEAPQDLIITDEYGKSLLAGDTGRRFFEASWVHKYNGKYYFILHQRYIIYVMPLVMLLTYLCGRILEPVVGWTSHHSICEFGNGTCFTMILPCLKDHAFALCKTSGTYMMKMGSLKQFSRINNFNHVDAPDNEIVWPQ